MDLSSASPTAPYAPTPAPATWTWRNRFAALGSDFHTRLRPTPLPAPHAVAWSRDMARALGLEQAWLQSQEGLAMLVGNETPPGADPLASVYSGHQFGVWAGQLGDGRAILLGEVQTPDGASLELQLKGAGRTPYSRMGDGRAVLRSSIREFLCSEAMHALGIPTTRALSVVGSPDGVRRETMETAAVVCRVAPSFIRFGHFEHFSYHDQHDALRRLADFVIDQYYPACRAGTTTGGNAYAALLQAVTERTAELLAQWQAVGFCHGVMNTDNMSILGLTIDYGPFQFLDAFVPGHICNHSDTQGRYAYDRQPHIAHWNLFCLGQALLPLIGAQEDALAALEPYKALYPQALQRRMGRKLGLDAVRDGDDALVEDTLRLLAEGGTDYSIFWRRLSEHVAGADVAVVRDLFVDREAFDRWLARHAARLEGQDRQAAGAAMLRTNPLYVLRNHLGEQAIRAAQAGDFSEVRNLLALLESPFDARPGHEAYADFPPDWAAGIEISCSS